MLATVVLSVAIGACSSASSDTATDTTSTAASTTSTSLALFTGDDDAFYETPDPLPEGEPGKVIRVMEVDSTDTTRTLKVMYHSRDAADTDRPATAMITHPTTEAPAEGWPVVATSPGTVGLDAHCGVSHFQEDAPAWGLAEDRVVRVIADYIGLGPTGQPFHAYLSKPSEGHAVLDAIRAAQQLPEVHAGSDFLSIGHSQGGHGALSTAQVAADYAPELNLLGTVALAPAAMLAEVYDGIDPIVTSVLTSMVLYGAAGEHADIDVDDYVTPELAEASEVFRTGCLEEITGALVPLVVEGKMFEVDPRTAPGAAKLIADNEVAGHAVDTPLYLAGATLDDRVVEQRVRDLYATLCEAGQVTEFRIFEGADHGTVLADSAPDVKAFLEARLAGEEAVDDCY